MTRTLTLVITTPLEVAVSEDAVTSVRAEDGSGGFGIQPGHADLLTVLSPSVLRWRRADGVWHYCALRSGVLRVSQGERIDIASREAVPGDNLEELEALVREHEAAGEDAARRARGEQVRLHANAIRSLMRRLGPHQAVEDLAEDFR
ncbi:F0F1 ATP synthase subunit epsilon [Labrenzia sp. 011]|uniref:F0F1 ATP synthase subunit epsilon n=1 Tax=Labrenzia sp. 011 TaxID=2171494 RepID=UPI000D512765|nr:F0F1 ATP synthase subunit epsilon [Labrenzia sp. 011]PVB59414.1 F0F1 ATP synthase subunit epsilon [Labrenzia sp. 011]